eukprot:m51a1_g436 hypothetical protein (733) ;mRNA; r:64669-67771
MTVGGLFPLLLGLAAVASAASTMAFLTPVAASTSRCARDDGLPNVVQASPTVDFAIETTLENRSYTSCTVAYRLSDGHEVMGSLALKYRGQGTSAGATSEHRSVWGATMTLPEHGATLSYGAWCSADDVVSVCDRTHLLLRYDPPPSSEHVPSSSSSSSDVSSEKSSSYAASPMPPPVAASSSSSVSALHASKPKSSVVPIAVGASVGCVALVAIAAIVAAVLVRRWRQRRNKQATKAASGGSPVAAEPRVAAPLAPTTGQGDQLAFYGAALVTVVSGTARVNGVDVAASARAHAVLAPFAGPAALVQPSQGAAVTVRVADVPGPLPSETAFRSPSSDAGPIEGLPRFFPSQGAEGVTVPVAWRKLAESVRGTRARVAVVGAKGAGKSTLARFAASSLAAAGSAPLFLDLDPGQPEFSAPGLVSLCQVDEPVFGPSAFFVGDVSPSGDPELYMRACRALIDVAHDAQGSAEPLIVNTCGWVSGLGPDVLGELLRQLRPTHLVRICTDRAQCPTADELGLDGASCRTFDLETTNPAIALKQQSQGPTAGVAREQQLLAYLRDHETPVVTAPALAASWGDLYIGFLVCEVPPSQAFYALNGSVVALCSIDADSTLVVNESAATEKDQYPKFLVGEPVAVPCLGLGIVRAIDPERRELHLVSPLAPEKMERVNAIIKGVNIDLPESMLNVVFFDAAQAKVIPPPYLVSEALSEPGTGGSEFRARKQLLRHSQVHP